MFDWFVELPRCSLMSRGKFQKSVRRLNINFMSTKSTQSKIKTLLPFLALILMLVVNFKDELSLEKKEFWTERFYTSRIVKAYDSDKKFSKTIPSYNNVLNSMKK